jgi:hypothetical protein
VGAGVTALVVVTGGRRRRGQVYMLAGGGAIFGRGYPWPWPDTARRAWPLRRGASATGL